MIVYSENGFNDWRGLCGEVRRIEAANLELDLANRELARTIERLKTDMGYIEHVARHELGMAADNEIVFRFKEKSGSETL
ncbi:MAG: septum formation initiator family protein [Desulfobacteraceae bacterium]|nr:septum formation initiator family protein [Desulfobacteraceae bacterium]